MEYCELCATSRFGGINLVSFVVNFFYHKGHNTCPAKAGGRKDLSRQSRRKK
ncbi:MAG: hypothetical protein LBS01_05055 [Prevotellaceae bacterium]|nr:hypothetical protein [Prevotellaceae bacterium]